MRFYANLSEEKVEVVLIVKEFIEQKRKKLLKNVSVQGPGYTKRPFGHQCVYPYRCPAIPYLYSFTEENDVRDSEKFLFIIKTHTILMCDFDMLLNEYR